MDIKRVKGIGNTQNLYMWNVSIPAIPFIGINNLEFQIRTTTIPGKTRSKNVMRYLGKQFTLPGAVTYDGEWTASVIMFETHTLYDQIIKWSQLIDEVAIGPAVEVMKGSAYIKLMGMSKNNITKRFILTGIYPLTYPGVDGLDMDSTDGSVKFDIVFAYDDIDFDPNNKLSF